MARIFLRFAECEHHFLMLERREEGDVVFERREEGDVVLVVNQNDGKGRLEHIEDAGASLPIHVPAFDAPQIPLQQAVGEQDKDDLVDHETECAGRELGEAGETLGLPVARIFHQKDQKRPPCLA